MKIVFLGTPDFAVPILESILTEHQVLAVVTQPDKARDKMKVSFSPVKECAIKNNIKVLQYERISRQGVEELKSLNADIMVTCAFGQILSREILKITKFGVINTHASLLPKYRGSSPIQWCIINGDKKTGITIMQTEYEVDSGDIIFQEETEILPNENAGQLFDRLSLLGCKAISTALKMIESGQSKPKPQNHSEATFCKMLTKKDGKIDWCKSYQEINCFILGMSPWPSAFTYLNGKMLKVYEIKNVSNVESEQIMQAIKNVSNVESEQIMQANESASNIKCGQIMQANEGASNVKCGQIMLADDKEGIIVAVKGGAIRLVSIQLEGGKRMLAKDYLRGHSITTGTVLGNNEECL